MHASSVDILAQQRGLAGGGGREVQAGDGADDLAVHLFGPRVIDIARTQASLDMVHRQLAVIGGQRARHGGGGVALDHHPRRLLGIHHPAQFHNQRGRERIKALVGAHQVEIVIGGDTGDFQNLIQHAAMLRRNTDARGKPRVSLERGDQRKQLDRFGTGAKNDENFGRSQRRCSVCHGAALIIGVLTVK